MNFCYGQNGKGQKIPNNVIEAVRFTSKAGFMTRELWHEYFVSAKRSAANEQFNFLLKKEILKLNKTVNDIPFYVLGSLGKSLKDGLSLSASYFPRLNQLDHDTFIFGTTYALCKSGIAFDWMTEAELKILGLSKVGKAFLRYPDSVVKVKIKNETRVLAIEYERTQKSLSRYFQILSAYASMTDISLVVFICNSPENMNIISHAISRLGNQTVNRKTAVCLAKEWRAVPQLAELKMIDRTFNLKSICEKASAEAPSMMTELLNQKTES